HRRVLVGTTHGVDDLGAIRVRPETQGIQPFRAVQPNVRDTGFAVDTERQVLVHGSPGRPPEDVRPRDRIAWSGVGAPPVATATVTGAARRRSRACRAGDGWHRIDMLNPPDADPGHAFGRSRCP